MLPDIPGTHARSCLRWAEIISEGEEETCSRASRTPFLKYSSSLVVMLSALASTGTRGTRALNSVINFMSMGLILWGERK
jgi:hypothetical protein